MEVLYHSCCVLDVHKKIVVACLLTIVGGKRKSEIRSFATTTSGLLELADWLKAEGCTHVAMESTGVYWKPIYNILEGLFQILVVNAQHLKRVPGRKTDVKDAEWIADLLQHGLLRGSFVPPAPQRELRDLTRYRSTLVAERTRIVNRLQKLLEDTNIKLTSVLTDITGVSGRAMLKALLDGQTDPKQLVELAKGRLRAKKGELEQALVGILKPHHRFLLSELLAHLDYLDESINRVSGEIEQRLRPFESEVARLDAITGIGQRIAQELLAEIGLDMSRFPTDRHISSWAAICPGKHQSAGKRYSGKTRKGNQWMRRGLIEAAHAASHTKGTYLSAQ